MMDGANGNSNDMVSMGKILVILLSGIENWLVLDCERKKNGKNVSNGFS